MTVMLNGYRRWVCAAVLSVTLGVVFNKVGLPAGWLIAGMEKVGLARKVVRISPERQAEKLLK